MTSQHPAVFRGAGGKSRQTSGVVRSCEVMPSNLQPHSASAVPGGHRLVKQSSRDSNDGSVSSEGSK